MEEFLRWHTAQPMQSASLPLAEPPVPESSATVLRGLRSMRRFMVATALVAIGLFAAFAAYRHQQLHEQATVRLERALAISHEHALRVLDTNDTLALHVLSLLGSDSETALRQREGELHRRLADLQRNKTQVQSIWAVGADGLPIATSRFAQAPRDRDIGGMAYFQWHRDKRGGVFASAVMQDPAGGKFFNISRGRYDADGRFAGIVSVGLHASYFTRFHEELSAEEPGLAITLFRGDGEVYSRWPELANAPARMSPRGEVLSRVLQGETSGRVESVSSLDGNKRIILFRKLGDYPIYIGTGREFAAINAEWLREITRVAGFVMLPLLALVVAAYLALKRTREAVDSTRRLEQESLARRKAEEALFQAQKMEALGRLTGGVAHDFNNALMIISANLHLLRAAAPTAPARFADAIARAVASSTKLTRQLLAFSRRQALAPRDVSLQEHLPTLRDLLAPVLGSKVRLAIEVQPGTPPIRVDVAELELALINVAVNARDAMPGGGEFHLGAAAAPGGMVAIEARDTGSGMDAETLRRAMEPFFTTKPMGQGTGLGLSQVHGLCARAGGDLQLQSTPGAGTTVRMLFPRSAGKPAPQAAPAPDERVQGTVLLVEDNPDVASVVATVLQRMGCDVVHRQEADQAIAWLAEHGDGCDLLLTDVVMPGERDGVALAQLVRAHHPHIRILLMTGYSQQIEEIHRLGLDVLAKPFEPHELARALRSALAREPAAA